MVSFQNSSISFSKTFYISKQPLDLDHALVFGNPWLEASTLMGGRQLGNVLLSKD